MDKAKKIILVLAVVVCAVSLLSHVRSCARGEAEAYRDTIRTMIVDTIPYYKPIPRDSVVVRYITERLPVVDSSVDKVDSSVDSVAVEIPITQKVYEDSAYTAWVSGYKPSLDSLILYPKREVVTIVERDKPKRWSVGVTAGYGVTIQGTPQFEPFIGIGVSYRLWGF